MLSRLTTTTHKSTKQQKNKCLVLLIFHHKRFGDTCNLLVRSYFSSEAKRPHLQPALFLFFCLHNFFLPFLTAPLLYFFNTKQTCTRAFCFFTPSPSNITHFTSPPLSHFSDGHASFALSWPFVLFCFVKRVLIRPTHFRPYFSYHEQGTSAKASPSFLNSAAIALERKQRTFRINEV